MGKVLFLNRVGVEPAATRDLQLERDRARILIYQACSILKQHDEDVQRLAWVLEDCADVLGSQLKDGERTWARS